MPNLQLQQFINLLFLLLLGYFSANIYLSESMLIFILLFSVGVEHLLILIKEKSIEYFSYSSATTAVGVMLMMVSSDYWVYFSVITLALLQKHFLRFKHSHIFNPSNFALIMALLLFYDKAHIVLGQLGDNVKLLYLVLLLGIIILWQAKRWLISVVFGFSYLCFQYLFIVSFDPLIIFEDIYERFYSISFTVFTLFMLTDPRTTPSNIWAQGIFASSIALMATGMDFYYGFRVQHLFLVLFLLSAFYALFMRQTLASSKDKGNAVILFLLALGVIIFIQMQEPYYFEMDG
ncbi:MAG: hypothetical protein L3J43_03125 [Sulfurovum sp.]|nr:hypothetical protein [Sulfurovum sp.]